MARIYRPDYCGARGRMTLARAARSSGALIQPKLDGQYVEVHTDRDGIVFAVRSRTGRDVASDLIGVDSGLPYAQLAAELQAHTEAGVRAAALAGYQSAVVFDVIRLDGRRVAELPFAARWDAYGRALGAAMVRQTPHWRSDDSGRAHDASGRFVDRVPRGWRRLPPADTWSARHAERAWVDWVERGEWCEGLVVVAPGAPVGARAGRCKVKAVDTLDAVVARVDARRALVVWRGRSFTIGRAGAHVRPGDTVEIAYEGFYERGATPRFPRLTRVRHDL